MLYFYGDMFYTSVKSLTVAVVIDVKSYKVQFTPSEQ
jgi:hypothetical protein